ncbi:hypothetical protein [Roseibium sp. RKSG952]|uniref:hypothetical protein n=1 Tax=Roseibium sp. RKSG952 TaxID=2529384 RepID=UPI0012BBE301|nr:hypothetical protein [Roseibium sp. RKSG952]MTH96698.1 hypothetical protein [Roseibium sp. RKSG952]
MTNFNQKISAMQLAIIEALRLATGQLSGNSREQTGAQHTLADQQDDRATVKQIERTRMDAMASAVSGASSCKIATGSSGGAIITEANATKRAITNAQNKWAQGDESMPSSLGQDPAALALLDAHCKKYATAANVAAGLCETEGDIPGGDIAVDESIFMQTDNATYGISEKRMEAANAFIANVVNPAPKTTVSDAQANTPEGRILAQMKNASNARMSISNETMAYLAAQVHRKKDGKTIDWAQGIANEIPGFNAAVFDDGVANKDFLMLQSRQFLLSPQWAVKSDKDEATAIKEVKNILAVIAYQGFENYQLLERIATNLAAQTAILSEQSPLTGRGL